MVLLLGGQTLQQTSHVRTSEATSNGAREAGAREERIESTPHPTQKMEGKERRRTFTELSVCLRLAQDQCETIIIIITTRIGKANPFTPAQKQGEPEVAPQEPVIQEHQ